MVGSIKGEKIDIEIYKKSLSLFFNLYDRKACKYTAKTIGSTIGTKIEVDEYYLESIISEYDLTLQDFVKSARLINNIITSIFKNQEDLYSNKLMADGFSVEECNEIYQLTKDYINSRPKLLQSFNFYTTTLSRILVSIDWRIQSILPRNNNDKKINSAKIILKHTKSYNGEEDETLELDLCLSDVEYMMEVLSNVRSELEKGDNI